MTTKSLEIFMSHHTVDHNQQQMYGQIWKKVWDAAEMQYHAHHRKADHYLDSCFKTVYSSISEKHHTADDCYNLTEDSAAIEKQTPGYDHKPVIYHNYRFHLCYLLIKS